MDVESLDFLCGSGVCLSLLLLTEWFLEVEGSDSLDPNTSLGVLLA